MSLPALEQVMWRLGNFPEDVARFKEMPDRYLSGFRLGEEERVHVNTLDVRALAELGVHTMLLLAAYRSVHGPQSIPEYMQRMNTRPPAQGAAHG